MIRDYLEEILNGDKSYDARAYDTKIRGTIALVDTSKSLIIGLVDLVNTHPISPSEYALWHTSGKFQGLVFEVDESKRYYAYEFINPRRLARPIKVEKNAKVFISINKKFEKKFIFQETLF